MSKTAMKLALEALENAQANFGEWWPEAITALREALAEQKSGIKQVIELYDSPDQPAQQEPVAWPCLIAEADFSEDTVTLAMQCTDYKVSAGKHWLSNTPPAQRKPLTDEEIKGIYEDCDAPTGGQFTLAFTRAIEAAHGIKGNT